MVHGKATFPSRYGVNRQPVIKEPDITLTKQGRNLTTGSGWAEIVYGEPGDQIEWRGYRLQVIEVGKITAD